MCPESLKTHHAVPLFHFAGIRLFRQAFPISVHDLHRRQRRLGSAGALLLNEARFSNIFIEKRASTCPQSLEKSRLFSYALLVSECENFQNMKRIFLRKVVI